MKRNILFEIDDPGKYFYTILKGSVFVLVPKTRIQEDETK